LLSALFDIGVRPSQRDKHSSDDQRVPTDELTKELEAIRVSLDNAQHYREATDNQNAPEKKRKQWRDKWRFGIEAAGLLVVAYYTFLTNRLVTETQKSVAAARASVAAAQASVAISEQGVHSGQRAYLLIENLRLASKHPICTQPTKIGALNVPLEKGARMWLQWDVKNAGVTPAQNIRMRFKFYIGENAPTPADGDRFGGYRDVLGPGECEASPDAPWIWLDRQAERTWKPEDMARVANDTRTGSEHLFAMVAADYETVFPGVVGHTSVCGYYDNAAFTSCGSLVK
jgi:hypothetical protein